MYRSNEDTTYRSNVRTFDICHRGVPPQHYWFLSNISTYAHRTHQRLQVGKEGHPADLTDSPDVQAQVLHWPSLERLL